MIRYYELTDVYRLGEIIRQDGRKHCRFSFGPFQWERTTMFQSYLTEGSPVYGRYRELDEQTVQKLLLYRGKQLSEALKKAEKLAAKAHAHQRDRKGKPYLEHIRAVADALPDWEEKIAAWLHEICSWGGCTIGQLRTAGFNERICAAVELLTVSADEGCSSYLTKLRRDRIARRVKIADIGWFIDSLGGRELSNEEAAAADQCREMRKYLFGDIADCPDTLDIRLIFAPDTDMIPAKRIFQSIYPQAFGGRKVPHGMSNPVLHRRDGQLFLAFFVYIYSRKQLQEGMIGRPVSWILADIRTGHLIEEISCSTQDFSSAGNAELYSVHNPNPHTDPNSFGEAYAVLDDVRRGYLEDGTVQKDLYDAYLDTILPGVPPAYHRFYRELSNP